jgi:hypothetical protein
VRNLPWFLFFQCTLTLNAINSPIYFILHITGPTSVRRIVPGPMIDLSSDRVGPRFLLTRSVFRRVGPYYLNDRVGLGPRLILTLARPETDPVYPCWRRPYYRKRRGPVQSRLNRFHCVRCKHLFSQCFALPGESLESSNWVSGLAQDGQLTKYIVFENATS